MDTIFALATAPGRAGVAVIRISGPDAAVVAGRLCGSVPDARGLRALKDPDGVLIDEALVLHFAAGHSFTGEAVVELQTHGSPAVVRTLLALLPGLGAREAEAGEFTRRALENGRLDLAQVEGLADLIDAETELQRRQAVRVFSGAMGDLVHGWRAKLVRAAALIEATIDFVDEDVPEDVYPEVVALLNDVIADLRREVSGVKAAERLRHGFEVAIVGPPNIGKSTLLNRIAGRDAAITSEIAGTTRDVIEVHFDLGGLPVTFLDTAGLREAEDSIERLGVERAIARAEMADLRIFITADGAEPDRIAQPDDLILVGKADHGIGDGRGISGKTGFGVDQLLDDVKSKLSARLGATGVATRERHAQAMKRGLADLSDAQTLIESAAPEDLIAEQIRSGLRAIEALIGRVDVEALLDEIFSSFCIGK